MSELKRYWMTHAYDDIEIEAADDGYWTPFSEADAVIKDLSLRIAVAISWCEVNANYFMFDGSEQVRNILTMPIESLHEFIKNNPQYGETV